MYEHNPTNSPEYNDWDQVFKLGILERLEALVTEVAEIANSLRTMRDVVERIAEGQLS